jgi:hypothetical protein
LFLCFFFLVLLFFFLLVLFLFLFFCFLLFHIILKFIKSFSISFSSFNNFKVEPLILVYLSSNRYIYIEVLVILIIRHFYKLWLWRPSLELLHQFILELYLCSRLKSRFSNILLHHFLLSHLLLLWFFSLWVAINRLNKLHLDYEQSHYVSMLLFVKQEDYPLFPVVLYYLDCRFSKL